MGIPPRSMILIPSVDLPTAFFVFFWGDGLVVALRFPTQVFDAPTLATANGSLAVSPPGDRAETGIVGKEMYHSNPRMGEIMLSKACIQTIKYKILRR
jgi:hypothetical protein